MHYDSDEPAEEELTSEDYRQEAVKNDEISPEEEAFIAGYEDDASPEAEESDEDSED